MCNKAFSEHDNLIKYQHIHFGEHPYICAVGSKSFWPHIQMLRQMENAAGGRGIYSAIYGEVNISVSGGYVLQYAGGTHASRTCCGELAQCRKLSTAR